MMFFSLAFVQSASASNPLLQLVPIVVIFGIFYVLLIAPMRKRQKALQNLIDDLKKGNRVVTSGGLHGEVAAVQDNTVLLKVADNLKVKVSKSAITGLQGQESNGS